MKEIEAIKELHEIRPRGGIIPQKRAEALDVAIQALEKQIPKKPIKKERSGIVYCVCGNFIGYKSPKNGKIPFKYCPNCGQKLDWSNENGFLRMAN